MKAELQPSADAQKQAQIMLAIELPTEHSGPQPFSKMLDEDIKRLESFRDKESNPYNDNIVGNLKAVTYLRDALNKCAKGEALGIGDQQALKMNGKIFKFLSDKALDLYEDLLELSEFTHSDAYRDDMNTSARTHLTRSGIYDDQMINATSRLCEMLGIEPQQGKGRAI